MPPGTVNVSVEYWEETMGRTAAPAVTLVIVEQPSVASVRPRIAQVGITSSVSLAGTNLNGRLSLECVYSARIANKTLPEISTPVDVITSNFG